MDNIVEDVKNICSVLGCVETKEITDAINELNLILQRKSEVSISHLLLKIILKNDFNLQGEHDF